MSYLLGLGECTTNPMTGQTTCGVPEQGPSWMPGLSTDTSRSAVANFRAIEDRLAAEEAAAARGSTPVARQASGSWSDAATGGPSRSSGGGFLDTLKAMFSMSVNPATFQNSYDRGFKNVSDAYAAPAVVPRGFAEASAAQDSALQQRMAIIGSMASGMRSFNAPNVTLPQMQIDYGSDYETAGRGGNTALVLAVLAGVGFVVYKKFGRKK